MDDGFIYVIYIETQVVFSILNLLDRKSNGDPGKIKDYAVCCDTPVGLSVVVC